MSNPSQSQYYTRVENTVVSPASVLAAQKNGNMTQLKQLCGSLVPAAAGNYAVVDADGNTLQVPHGALVQSVIYGASPLGSLVGGTSMLVGAAATDGGAVVQAFSAASVLANQNLNEYQAGTLVTGVLLANQYVSATVVGTYTGGATATVCINYYDPQSLQ